MRQAVGGTGAQRDPRAEQVMREAWNKRARHDAMYWINTQSGRRFRSVEAFFEAGAKQAGELTAAAFERLSFDPRGKAVLEVGCGVGRLFPGFQRLGFSEICGVDVSDEMVRLGRDLCPVKGARIILGNGQDFQEIQSSSVDYCFSYNVLQHLPSREILWSNLGEMRRVLRPGGAFQLHLRARRPLKRRVLAMLPERTRTRAQAVFRVLSLSWLRGQPVGGHAVGGETTWDLGATIPPGLVQRRLAGLGFTGLGILPDPTYPDGGRYWVVGKLDRPIPPP